MIISKITESITLRYAKRLSYYITITRNKYRKIYTDQGVSSLRNVVGQPIRFYFSQEGKQITIFPSIKFNNRYLKLIEKIQDPQHFQSMCGRLKQICNEDMAFDDYKRLKMRINELLYLSELYCWSEAYHSSSQQLSKQLLMLKVQKLIELSFSQKFRNSHQTVQEQILASFRTLRLSIYFSLVGSISPKIVGFYLDSYMHLNRQKNVLEYIKCNESICERYGDQVSGLVGGASNAELERWVEVCRNRWMSGERVSEIQMAVYLSYFKRKKMEANKQFQQIILGYIGTNSGSQSFLHLQNTVYCLYFAVQRLGLVRQICDWLVNGIENNAVVVSYLTTLFSHEDKLTCLKVDLLISLREFIEKNTYHVKLISIIDSTLDQLSSLNYKIWSYKYSIWLSLSLTSLNPINLLLITKLVDQATCYTLNYQCFLSSLITLLQVLSGQNQLSELITIQAKVSQFLAIQPSEALLTQTVAGLCSVLHHADRHPALQKIYLGYLKRLLKVSLGHFEWNILTQLYYFGLRWGAGDSSEGRELMEYVRRYILNQYSAMGIRRRQIPEDSYFYKIHAITTPEQFYRNHLQNL